MPRQATLRRSMSFRSKSIVNYTFPLAAFFLFLVQAEDHHHHHHDNKNISHTKQLKNGNAFNENGRPENIVHVRLEDEHPFQKRSMQNIPSGDSSTEEAPPPLYPYIPPEKSATDSPSFSPSVDVPPPLYPYVPPENEIATDSPSFSLSKEVPPPLYPYVPPENEITTNSPIFSPSQEMLTDPKESNDFLVGSPPDPESSANLRFGGMSTIALIASRVVFYTGFVMIIA